MYIHWLEFERQHPTRNLDTGITINIVKAETLATKMLLVDLGYNFAA